MAIMRTNRLASKTTTPPKRSFTPASELEAQDAKYTRYKQDTEAYGEKMKRYNQFSKDTAGGRDYRPFFGNESNTRRLTTTEAEEWNKTRKSKDSDYLYNQGDLYIEERNINVPKGAYKGLSDSRGKEYGGNVTAWMSDYVKPTAPTKADKADWSKVQLDKLPTKKAVITPSAKLKTKGPVQAEKPAFEGPQKSSGVRDRVDMNPLAKGAYTKGSNKRYVKQVVGSVGKEGKTKGFDREEKLFKAYAGTSVLDESHIGKTKSELKDYKNEMKSQNKAYRREGNIEGAIATGMEVKQARQAAKYVDRASKGKNRYFNDSNYTDIKGKNARIAVDYKESADNAANRNTMQAKLKAATKSATNSSQGYLQGSSLY